MNLSVVPARSNDAQVHLTRRTATSARAHGEIHREGGHEDDFGDDVLARHLTAFHSRS
jgi:hypothetical protein